MQASSPQFQVMEAVKEASIKNLEIIEQKIKTDFNNPNHTFSLISSFNTLIVEINELFEGNVMDMIIMGTKGVSGVKGVLFGSNTVHVLKNAKCPVIAIPSDFSFEAPHEILFPSDFEINFQDKQLKPLIDIATTYHARVNILHAFYGNDLSEIQQENRIKLEGCFNSTSHLFHNIKNENIPEAITKFQLKTRINLLVMLNNKHSFFENLFFKSTIKQIGFHLNIPFLVIPSKI